MNKDKEYMRPIINKMSLVTKLSTIFKYDNDLFKHWNIRGFKV